MVKNNFCSCTSRSSWAQCCWAHTPGTHHVGVNGTAEREPGCCLDGPQFGAQGCSLTIKGGLQFSGAQICRPLPRARFLSRRYSNASPSRQVPRHWRRHAGPPQLSALAGPWWQQIICWCWAATQVQKFTHAQSPWGQVRDSRVGVGSRKTFNGAAFAEDIEAEEHDFRATLKQATQERADFAKGLVFVKEYEAHTERLRVEQDKLKFERQEEKRKDLQVVWASPVFDSPRALEGCAISRAPAPSDAFATPPDNNINVCFLLQPRLWAGSATACWRGASVWQIVWLLFLSGSLHCLIAKWHNSSSPLVWCLQQTSTRCSLNYSSSDTVHITQHILGTRIINFDLVNLPVSCPPTLSECSLCLSHPAPTCTTPLCVSLCSFACVHLCDPKRTIE